MEIVPEENGPDSERVHHLSQGLGNHRYQATKPGKTSKHPHQDFFNSRNMNFWIEYEYFRRVSYGSINLQEKVQPCGIVDVALLESWNVVAETNGCKRNYRKIPSVEHLPAF